MKLLFVTENKNEKDVNEISATVSTDGITRNLNVVPEGIADIDSGYGKLVAGPPRDGLAKIPIQLKDWLYLTTLSITSGVAASGGIFNPYELFLELDYVKRVLTGRPVGKLCLELRFSAQPTAYHYGIMVFSWLPNCTDRPTQWNAAAQYASAAYSSSRKHVARIDFAKPTVVTVRCPIVDPFGSMRPLTNNCTPNWADDAGRILYNSLTGNLYRQDGSYTTVGVEVLCRLTEDSEVYGLTAGQFYSISTRSEGPISSVLTAANAGFAAAGKASGGVLSKITSPFEFITRYGASMAKELGFGVPIKYDSGSNVSINVNGGTGASDIQNIGDVMAFSAANARGVYSSPGDDDGDECAIDYICSRYGMIHVGTIASTDAQGTVLLTIPVDPMYTGITSGAGVYNPPSSVAWMGAYFMHWTGGLTYRLSVVSSKYHSGRLRITYDPDQFMNTATPPTLAAQTHCFSEVFDIAEGVVVEFTVPWMSTLPWAYLQPYATATTPGNVYTRDILTRSTNNGFLLLTIESALTSVAATPSSIFIVFEVKGGPGFTLAYPTQGTAGYIPVSAKVGADNHASVRVLGAELPYKHKTLVNFGEEVTNIRQLCKQYCTLGNISIQSEGVIDPDRVWNWQQILFPYVDDDMFGLTADLTVNYNRVVQTQNKATIPLVYFRRGFALASGGVRWKIKRGPFGSIVVDNTAALFVPEGPYVALAPYEDKTQLTAVRATSVSPTIVKGLNNAMNNFNGIMLFGGATQLYDLSKHPAEFTIPMRGPSYGIAGYCHRVGKVLSTTPDVFQATAIRGQNFSGQTVEIIGYSGLVANCQIVFECAAADDYNLMYYDGPPPSSTA